MEFPPKLFSYPCGNSAIFCLTLMEFYVYMSPQPYGIPPYFPIPYGNSTIRNLRPEF